MSRLLALVLLLAFTLFENLRGAKALSVGGSSSSSFRALASSSFSYPHQQQLLPQQDDQVPQPLSLSSRRQLLQKASFGTTAAAIALFGLPSISQASTTTDALIQDLISSQAKLQEIPDLLQAQEWDKVRTILKTPPVNKLWNLGDSVNPILALAKDTGNVEWFEVKDELAYQLQITDQLTYDNVFVYFQPGSGKIKIKEPTQAAQMAIKALSQVITEAKDGQ